MPKQSKKGVRKVVKKGWVIIHPITKKAVDWYGQIEVYTTRKGAEVVALDCDGEECPIVSCEITYSLK